MTKTQSNQPPRRPLRLWPGIVIVTLMWVGRLVVPMIAPEAGPLAMLGAFFGSVLVLVWWVLLSRAPHVERWGAVAIMGVALFVTSRFLHESIATGMMGMMFPLYAPPVLSLALVAWAVATRGLPDGLRRVTMVASIFLACGGWTLVRTGGFTGEIDHDFAWRWAATPEDRLLAQAPPDPTPPPVAPPPAAKAPEDPPLRKAEDEPAATPPAPPEPKAEPEWPGFRGPARDDVIPGVRIETDWSKFPPVELWRRPIGPGWSSFAVQGDLLYTQEQRGEDEVVTAYDLMTGEPVWRHRDPVRFWESNGGPGPRATPTLHSGRVYTFGGTGILNVLDASNGALVWSRDVASDAEKNVPTWGFASSPWVIDDLVIVAAAGRLVAYDLATGEPRWLGPDKGGGYSSPHLSTIEGVDQVLLSSESGMTSVAPADGSLLWEHSWPGDGIVQPAFTADGDILLGSGSGMGIAAAGVRRLAVAREPNGWTAEERWTSIRLKPYYNDFVVHEGHAYGFDGSILACMGLENGERKWKGGRYGYGQLVLLREQDLLFVLSEHGELALVSATPDEYKELARFPAIEGKTWNHPVLVGDLLLVRNGREMAAFRLSQL